MTKLIIIVAIVFAVIIFVSNLNNGSKLHDIIAKILPPKGKSVKNATKAETDDDDWQIDPTTSIFSHWSCCVLDPKDGRVVKGPVSIVPTNHDGTKAFTIGASEKDNITINSSHYVSKAHLLVCEDERGLYAIDNKSLNGSYINGNRVKDYFDLKDKMVVYLTDIPVYFFKNSLNQNLTGPIDISFHNSNDEFKKAVTDTGNNYGPFNVSVTR